MKPTIAAMLCCGSLLAGSLEIGVRKLNLAKSKFSSGPPPRSRIPRIEPEGESLRYTREDVTPEGKPSSGGGVARFDGMDYPQNAIPFADTLSSVRIDTLTTEHTCKKAGKVVRTVRDVLSAGGNVLTRTMGGVNERGQKVSNVMVFEKQRASVPLTP